MAMAHRDIATLLKKHGFAEIRKVGEGSFGKAILVQSQDGSRLICKMVDISRASPREMQDAVKEGKLLAQLRHPYIVRYCESFTESGWLCILMDYCEGGDLTKQIEEARRARRSISEEQIMKWFTQAILALKYIHDKHILHRDLKPSNFFLAQGKTMKMGDFGIAKVLSCTIAVARTQIGTPYYLSPEVCQEKPYTWPSDMWAMGCILYEMCALKVPFDAPNIPGLVQKITRGTVPSVPSTYSPFVRQLCGEMLNRNPDARPSTDDILQRPAINAVVKQSVEEESPKAAANPGGDDGSLPAAPAAAPSPAPLEGAYGETAGTYKRGDLVDYLSSAHKEWLPARVMNVDGDGRIIIDLKPNTWITAQEQATKVRPRQVKLPERAVGRAASPMVRRSPSVGSVGGRPSSRAASPMVGNSPSWDRPASRANSPRAMQRNPSVGPYPRPNSRGAPPSPRGFSPSRGCPSPLPGWGSYRKGDLVEFYSQSHKDWLPATILNVDSKGSIIIDLKPNTWITVDEQTAKVRRRARAGSRCASPYVQRSPSNGALRAMTPGAPSPGRAPSPRGGAGGGTPRVRPPGIPRVSDSPLRHGGRNIAGLGY
mmetsp:Transcript_61653/g.133512  ORF Transcript_61653/g.133512 Transcript_61653/m.133512 type:complete len:598 (-) Transcript_61653:278-2071(-)|eukprot:CAMPEP_0170610064 /NCGR_PEP_ID=MMETSP0224-20130122/22454_1 /TAXON_ID=285029 /ORGANISM="Togula jolla, Strain CCCM 725" /LENGTH=597 /DNA_ID=CAMNT_0010935403 /DNA_START=50 /DNA_END=1843 /DNA_ORIENTATION=-